ncbi:MAG: methyltransferase domain-containing protein [Methylococcales bacterium]
MERLEREHFDTDILMQTEHRHRYMWATQYASGDVCDLACGYGYGAEIIATNCLVKSYVGIDASTEAIAYANQRFASNEQHYILASAASIPLADRAVDTIVSLETLEHLINPSLALIEFKRILRPDGVLVGSVPSKYFDDRAEEVYGENPYHVTRFTHADLVKLLGNYFNTVRIYYSALEVVSHIGTLINGHPSRIETAVVIRNDAEDEVSGSFHFVATNRHSPDIDTIHQNQISFCIGLTDMDALRVIPLRQLVAQNEQLVHMKDEYISQSEKLIQQRDQELRIAEKLVQQRDQEILQRDQEILAIPKVFRWISKRLPVNVKNS